MTGNFGFFSYKVSYISGLKKKLILKIKNHKFWVIRSVLDRVLIGTGVGEAGFYIRSYLCIVQPVSFE